MEPFILNNGVERSHYLDSAKSTGGKFELKGAVEVPDLCILVLGECKQVPVLVENKAIHVAGKSDDLRNITITGSASQDEMKALEAKGTVINTKMKEIYGKYNEAKQKMMR